MSSIPPSDKELEDDTTYKYWYDKLSTSKLSADTFAAMSEKDKRHMAFSLAWFNAFHPAGSAAWRRMVKPQAVQDTIIKEASHERD